MTEQLGIDLPIMQSGMQNLATPELAAAVSNSGGLGTINGATYAETNDFRRAIRTLKSLTDRPFCVNISMLPFVSAGDRTEEYVRTAVEEGVTIIETAGRNPEPYVPMLKENGVLLIHKAPTVKHAKKAQDVGADMVSIMGIEGAGHPGMNEVSTSVLVSRAIRELDIPVLAGGGIADGKGVAAALALGAEGVFLGTRFAATRECIIHDQFKTWITEASEADTVLIQRTIKNMVRVMNNAAAREVQQLEAKGATLEELFPVISGKRGFKAQMEGDLDGGLFSVGQAVGLISDVPSIEELMKRLAQEMVETIRQLSAKLN